jgi:subtilisin family serine protease
VKRLLAVLILLVAAACADTSDPLRPTENPSPALGRAGNTAPFVTGQILTRFAPGAGHAAIAAQYGASIREELLIPGIWLLSVPAGSEGTVAAALARNPNVVFAEPDWLLSTTPCELSGGCPSLDDPFWGRKWDLHNDGFIRQTDGSIMAETGAIDADIDWLEAYTYLGGSFGGSAVIGIIDTGIRNTHEDLAGKVWKNRNFEGLILVDPNQWNDSNGHGTHVAAIAAGLANNGKGVAGVGYGNDIRLINARVCGTFGCPTSAIVNAIRWATDEGANVLNLSLGGPTAQTAIRDALVYARDRNVLPVCASGNDGANAVSFPAAFSECVAVGSTNWGDTRAGYSNWGPEVELAAPGGDTNPAGTAFSYIASAYHTGDDAYVYMAGTSMAAPQVAGLAALLYAAGVTDATQIRSRMRLTADDLGPTGWDPEFGYGRINAYRAVADLDPGEPGDPGNPGDPGEGGDDPDPEDPPTPIVASFSYQCRNSSTCNFRDESTGDISAWAWSFQNGDPPTATEPNPTVTFTAAGTQMVVLEVTGDAGTDSAIRYIECSSHPRQGVRCK